MLSVTSMNWQTPLMDKFEDESNLSPSELGELFTEQDAFMKLLGAELLGIGTGTAKVSMCVQPSHLNFNQTCHGGVIFSLADCALAFHPIVMGSLLLGSTRILAIRPPHILERR